LKTILLTGASGFIGKHLLVAIAKLPEYRDRIVLLSSTKIEGYTTIIHNNYNYGINDFLQSGVNDIEIIIHSGAFTPKSGRDANLLAKSKSNIDSVFHLINNLPNIPKKIIFLSTLDVYQSCEEPINEASTTLPATLYGWSKLYGEKMLEQWANANGVALQILRIGHIYGSGEEHYQKLIPVSIRKALKGESPSIFTKGEELRSFLHVSDCINAIVSAINLNADCGPINIASDKALSVKQIIQIIIDEVGLKTSPIIQANNIPGKNVVFDNTKMITYLTEESITFINGIREEIKNFIL
jgi:UDP-glucose 4-epimerase